MPAPVFILGGFLAASPIASAAVVEVTLFGQIPDNSSWQEHGIAGLFIAGTFSYNTQIGTPVDSASFNTPLIDLGFFIGPSPTDFSDAAFFSAGPETVGNLAVDRRGVGFRVDDVVLISGSFPFSYFGFIYNSRFDEWLENFPGDVASGQPFTPRILDAATEKLLGIQAEDADRFISSDIGIMSLKTQAGSGGTASIFPSIYSLEVISVPEPSSVAFLMLAAVGGLGFRRREKRN